MAAFTSDQKLGDRQVGVLRALVTSGPYHANGGWVWTNSSTTSAILRSLAKRGLVTVIMFDTVGPWKNHVKAASINDAGRAALAAALETEKS